MRTIPISERSGVDAWAISWWSLVLRGVAAVGFGLLCFLAPGLSLSALVMLFGAYAFVDGISSIVLAFRKTSGERWWALLLKGIVGLAAGVGTVLLPLVTALALVYLVAVWAIATGVLEIVTAVRLRKVIQGEWLLGLSGLASTLLGISLALFPGPGALALVFWLGAYALVSGVLLIALGIRARSWQHGHVQPPMAHAENPT
jgi:uncharacterized membrane protein HdeD (DUF308 family)